MATSFSTSGPRLDRKSLKKPDQFFKAISQFFDQLSQHTNAFVIGIVVLLVLGIAAGFWMNHSDAKTESARNALFLAEKSIAAETKGLDPSLKALDAKLSAASDVASDNAKDAKDVKDVKPEDEKAMNSKLERVVLLKIDVDAKFPDSIKQLKAIDQDFGKTRPAFEARLKLASLYYNHSDFNKALPWFEKAVSSAPSHSEKAFALSSVGYTYEGLNKFNEAIQAYQKAISLGEAGLKGDLLLSIARSYDALHDTAKARSTYDQIISELPGTDYSKSAELYKSWLQ